MCFNNYRPSQLHASGRLLLARRVALMFGILLSGGMLIFPRGPMLVALIVFALAATGWRGIPLVRTRYVFLLLIAILFFAIVRGVPFRGFPLDFDSLIVRYANFFGGLILLATYLRSGLPVLSKDLFAIMPWMSAQAILTFFLANLAPSIFSVISLPDEGVINTFLLIFNWHEFIENYSGWRRADGFFWEPGVFQMYLNFYLYLALFVYGKRQHIFLALLALASVYSTTGIFVTGLLLCAALFRFWSNGNWQNRLRILLLVIFLAPPFGYLAFSNLEDKFTGESYGSSLIRRYDFIVGYNIVSAYPMLGIGFDHRYYQDISWDLSPAHELGLASVPERSTSNGLLYLIYTLGIPLALVFSWGMFNQKFFRERWLVGILMLLSMFGEALIFTPFVLMIIFSAFLTKRYPSSLGGVPKEGVSVR